MTKKEAVKFLAGIRPVTLDFHRVAKDEYEAKSGKFIASLRPSPLGHGHWDVGVTYGGKYLPSVLSFPNLEMAKKYTSIGDLREMLADSKR